MAKKSKSKANKGGNNQQQQPEKPSQQHENHEIANKENNVVAEMTHEHADSHVEHVHGPNCSHDHDHEHGQVHDTPIVVNIQLPRELGKLSYTVPSSVSISDIRQLIHDSPDSHSYTCFHFTFNGKKVPEMTMLVQDLEFESEKDTLEMVENPYNEREVRIQLAKFREYLGNGITTGLADKVGADYGSSVFSSVFRKVDEDDKENDKKDDKKEKSGPIDAYNFDRNVQLSQLFPSSKPVAPAVLKKFAMSGWNSPPPMRRAAGDLMYLAVTSLENDSMHITCSVSGFFVNKSTDSVFDPAPRTGAKACFAHTLPRCLELASPLFAKGFAAQRDYLAKFHTAELMPSPPFSVGNFPWMVPEGSKSSEHTFDLSRLMDSHIVSQDMGEGFGGREWNEDLQCANELTFHNLQERTFREQQVYRVHADFVEAATKGAVNIINGSLPALNSFEPNEESWIYVHNGIFYSHALDGRENFKELGPEAPLVAVSKDIDGIRMFYEHAVDPALALYTLATCVIDIMGRRITAQALVPGVLQRSQRGEKVVSYGKIESASEEVKNEMVWEETWHKNMEKVAKLFRLSEHEVVDKDGVERNFWTPVEVKGMSGTDGRNYLLDFFRMTPVDILFREEVEAEDSGINYPHRLTLLRHELVQLFMENRWRAFVAEEREKWKAEEEKKNPKKPEEENKEETDKSAEEQGPSEEELLKKFNLAFNPDAFTSVEHSESYKKTQLPKDEQLIREAGTFLRDRMLASLIMEFLQMSISPLDGANLTSILHGRGINMRYLGKLVDLIDKVEKSVAENASGNNQPSMKTVSQKFAYVRALCVEEMVVRAAKKVWREYMRKTPLVVSSEAIAHFLNCLFNDASSKVKANMENMHSKNLNMNTTTLPITSLSPISLWNRLRKEVKSRFLFNLPEDYTFHNRVGALRNFCIKTGIQLVAKNYATIVNCKLVEKQSGGVAIFEAKDILAVAPVIKSCIPRSSVVEDTWEAGRMTMNQGQLLVAREVLMEAAYIAENVYSFIHPDIGKLYSTLSSLTVNLAVNEMREAQRARAAQAKESGEDVPSPHISMNELLVAREWQSKAVVIYERTLGWDHPETITAYMTLANYETATGHVSHAEKGIAHALQLWDSVIGKEIPHHMNTEQDTTAASLLQGVPDKMDMTIKFLERAYENTVNVFGLESIPTVNVQRQLVRVYSAINDFKKSLHFEKLTYNHYKTRFGADDERTKESSMLLKILTERAVAVAKSSSQPSTPITASAPSPAAAVETKSAAMNNEKPSSGGKKKKSKK